MTTAQIIYLAALAISVLMFGLFMRYFWWKRYSESNFWDRRPTLTIQSVLALAAEKGRELPFVSILVPARNEADVIERTIDHLSSMEYPKDRYEIVVVTDDKELQGRDDVRARVIAETESYLRHAEGMPSAEARSLLVTAFTMLQTDLWQQRGGHFRDELKADELPDMSRRELSNLLRDTSEDLILGKGRIPLNKVYRRLRRTIPGISDKRIEDIYPVYLSICMPVVDTYFRLRGSDGHELETLIQNTAHAHHRVTKKILSSMTDTFAGRILNQLESMATNDTLAEFLTEAYSLCFPTTQEIVERKRSEFAARTGVPFVRHIGVPYDFDGLIGGQCLGHAVTSTKGRALNFALPKIDTRTSICAFYDAESRPETGTMLFIAYRSLTQGADMPKIFQGPVFQVRNFYEMGWFSRIAGLYTCVSHDWFLPVLLRKLPFSGGTNVWVDHQFLMDLGGFDNTCLTEDLELGTRAWLGGNAWPEYLPYGSSEQTPPTVKGFFRQRLRWGYGHLQVTDKVKENPTYPPEKKNIIWWRLLLKGGVGFATVQALCFLPPTFSILYFTGNMDTEFVPPILQYAVGSFSLIALGFTVYAFFRYYKWVDQTARPLNKFGYVSAVAGLFILPIASFLLPAPYTYALMLKSVGKGPKGWVKTPRTKE